MNKQRISCLLKIKFIICCPNYLLNSLSASMRATYLICIGALFCSIATAQVQGPLSPSGFTTVPITGSSATWSVPEESGRSDDSYSTFGNLPDGPNSYTNYLVVTDFNFNIPPGSTILGILVEVEKSDPSKVTTDFRARIVKGGLIGTTEKAVGPYPENDAYESYGGPTDLWGLSWNYKDITNNDFGFAIAAQRLADGGTTDGQIDHIQITVFFSVSLPVKLLSFSAVKGKTSVQLTWTTAEESDMDHYNVERSADGTNFLPISNVSSQNRTTVSSYSSVDNNPTKGVGYYRLKMTDKNGIAKYSGIVAVHFTPDRSISLFPNPLLRGQTLYINNPDNELLRIQFFDLAGKLLSAIETTSGEVLSVPANHKGFLFYRVNNRNGEIMATGKLVVE